MKRSVLLTLGLLMLTACSRRLDRDRIAQSIQQDVIKRGGLSLKTVTCPQTIKPEAGQLFECIGETDTGYTFTIPVKQQDDRGTVVWDVPNAKGLLNVAKFETLVQAGVESEIGSRPIIRCGGIYKAVRPGQTFECAVDVKEAPPKNPKVAKLKAIPLKPNQPDRILVMIDADRNVNWQRVVPGATTSLVADQSTAATQKPPPSKSSAEDFLKQPGATDQF